MIMGIEEERTMRYTISIRIRGVTVKKRFWSKKEAIKWVKEQLPEGNEAN